MFQRILLLLRNQFVLKIKKSEMRMDGGDSMVLLLEDSQLAIITQVTKIKSFFDESKFIFLRAVFQCLLITTIRLRQS